MTSTAISISRSILLSILLMFALGAGFVFATDISSCQTISSSGSYTLTQDVSGGGTCFMIAADNVILDCAGHSITGTGDGIDNSAGYDSVTVKNCIITGFNNGIDFENGADYGTIENNTVSSTDTGIYFSGSNNIITNNNVSSNINLGIYSDSSSNNTITNNNISNNGGEGVYLYNSGNNNITNNTASLNVGTGIDILFGSNNIVINNNVNSNSGDGIDLRQTGSDNVVINNVVINNVINSNHDGILLFYSSDNIIVANNTIDSNLFNGVDIYVSSNDIVTNNTLGTNGNAGVHLDSSSNNNLTRNTITDSGYACVKITNSDHIGVSKNICKKNSYGIVSDPSSNNIFDSNTIEDTQNAAILMDYSMNDTAIGNSITNAAVGIELLGTTDSSAISNTITGSASTITLAASTDATISSNVLQNNVNNTVLVDSSSAGSVTSDVPYTTYFSCQPLTTSGTYTLTRDAFSVGSCFTIAAKNVTIDCAGHSITGDGQDGNGIDDSAGYGHLTVKNCNISGFSNAIDLENGASYGMIENNTVSSNTQFGIGLVSSFNNTITGNNASLDSNGICLDQSFNNTVTGNIANSDARGISLTDSSGNNYGSNNNIITGNNVTSNGDGIYLEFSSNKNTITNNDASSSGDTSIYLFSSNGNNISRNTASSNSNDGIYLTFSSNYNTISNNNASSNSNDGISLSSSSNYNTITSNTASSNNYGISFYSSSSNTISNNTASSNGYDGIYLSISNGNVITKITANGNSNYGIDIESSSNNTVSASVFDSNGYDGIYLLSSPSNTITKNTVSGNGNYGIDIESYSTGNTVTGNTVTGSGVSDTFIDSTSSITAGGPCQGSTSDVLGTGCPAALRESGTLEVQYSGASKTSFACLVTGKNGKVTQQNDCILPLGLGPVGDSLGEIVTLAHTKVFSLSALLNMSNANTGKGKKNANFNDINQYCGSFYDATGLFASAVPVNEIDETNGSAAIGVPVADSYVVVERVGIIDPSSGNTHNVTVCSSVTNGSFQKAQPYPRPGNFAWAGGLFFQTYNLKTKQYVNSNYTLNITRGCSCAQILAFLPGNNKGQLSNGCTKGTMDNFIHMRGPFAQKKDKNTSLVLLSCSSPVIDFNPANVNASTSQVGLSVKKMVAKNGITLSPANGIPGTTVQWVEQGMAQTAPATAGQESLLLSIFDSSADAVVMVGLLVALAVGFLFGRKTLPSSKRKGKKK